MKSFLEFLKTFIQEAKEEVEKNSQFQSNWAIFAFFRSIKASMQQRFPRLSSLLSSILCLFVFTGPLIFFPSNFSFAIPAFFVTFFYVVTAIGGFFIAKIQQSFVIWFFFAAWIKQKNFMTNEKNKPSSSSYFRHFLGEAAFIRRLSAMGSLTLSFL